MGLLDKLLNKDGPDGEADKQTRDWLSKLDEQINESTDATAAAAGHPPPPPPSAVPESLRPARNPGPVGDVVEHLHVLEILPGATWSEVSNAHASALSGLGPDAELEAKRRINCAYAALRVNGQ